VLLQQRFSKMLLQGCLMLLCLSWLLLMPLIADATNADGDALKAVQASLTGSGQAFVTWDITLVNPCTWINVECDSQNNIIYLNLGNQGLSGTLAPQIGNLPFLQNLYLQNNSISGEIPATIGQLTNLTTLFLYANNFTGEIPSAIGNLSGLKLLQQ
jgi:Leucine-rich repeat (LRR) protein